MNVARGGSRAHVDLALRRALIVGLALIVGVGLASVAEARAQTGSVELSVVSWDVDWDTGVVSYEITATGQRCAVTCSVRLVGLTGTAGSPYPVNLGSKSVSAGTTSYAATFTRSPSAMREVTEVQAVLKEAVSGQVVAESAVVSVASGNPVPGAWLSVRRWVREPTTGAVDYEFTIRAQGLAGVGDVCEVSCRFEVAGVLDSGQTHVLASSGTMFNKWHLQGTYAQPARALPVLSYLQFEIESTTGSPDPIVRQYPLPDVYEDPSQSISGDYQLRPYVAVLGAVPLSDVCLAVAHVAPYDSPDPDSAPDAFQRCEEARLAGLPLRQVLQKVVEGAVGAGAVLDGVLGVLDLDKDPPTGGVPPIPGPSDPTLGQSMQGEARNDAIPDNKWPVVAAQCRALVARALPLPGYTGAGHPCTGMPIYLPGSDIASATQHRIDAILASPEWVQLHYLLGEEREKTLDREWYRGLAPCLLPVPGGKSCDEYPNYATDEAGPGASLLYIDAQHNSLEGAMYSGFVTSCGLKSHDPFLVVPLAFDGAPTTSWVKTGCRR